SRPHNLDLLSARRADAGASERRSPCPSLPRLPDRPSLEHLHKQAKGLLRDYRSGVPSAVERVRAVCPQRDAVALADAHFVLAREYGFASWPKLVHHVAGLHAAAPLAQFTELANDIAAACAAGDAGALERVNRRFGKSFGPEDLR